MTDRPWSRYCLASLPMVVVLPEPFTPTTRTTCGLRLRSGSSGTATGARISAMSAASAVCTSSGVTSWSNFALAKLLARRAAVATPRSPVIRVSSSSWMASSSSLRLLKIEVMPSVSRDEDRLRPAASRPSHPRRWSLMRPPVRGRRSPAARRAAPGRSHPRGLPGPARPAQSAPIGRTSLFRPAPGPVGRSVRPGSAADRRSPASRSRAARSRRTGMGTCGIRAAGVPGRSE